ncbi:MAG: nucleoside hydrolase [Eubacteriales bacterium]
MSHKRNFILDTDIGPDCDDCGALAIFDRFHKAGRCELLGVTHCTSDRLGADVIAAINDWFGVNVPIGQTAREGFLCEPSLTKYTAPVSEAYRKHHAPAAYEPALPLLRRLLAENRHVTLVFIGPLGNMSDLLRSAADEISPLSGTELVRQSVDRVVVMGGNFRDFSHGEYNIACDVPAAQLMTEQCGVPIVYCGFEAGEHVMTGASLEDCPEDDPVRMAYQRYLNGGFVRNSWDLVTVYYALNPDDERWILSDERRIRFRDDATADVTEGTGARYVRFADEAALEEILNGILSEKTEI